MVVQDIQPSVITVDFVTDYDVKPSLYCFLCHQLLMDHAIK